MRLNFEAMAGATEYAPAALEYLFRGGYLRRLEFPLPQPPVRPPRVNQAAPREALEVSGRLGELTASAFEELFTQLTRGLVFESLAAGLALPGAADRLWAELRTAAGVGPATPFEEALDTLMARHEAAMKAAVAAVAAERGISVEEVERLRALAVAGTG